MKKEEIKKLLEPTPPEVLLYAAEIQIAGGVMMAYILSDYGKHLQHLDPLTQMEFASVVILTPPALTYAAIRGYKLLEHFSDSVKKKKL